jgi:hypothetical protein
MTRTPCSLPLFTAAVLLAAAAAPPARAQITVTGIADQTVYDDDATFRVPAVAGYEYTALLNGEPVAVNAQVTVAAADYYELAVSRRNTTSGAVENLTLQFIVRSTERGNSEWGLTPWVPFPPIPSAAAEFAGATVKLVAPRVYPRGLEIPLVARVEDAAGKRRGVNGFITAAAFPDHPLELLRGVGSVLLPPATAGGTLNYAGGIHAVEVTKTIDIEASTTWTAVSGNIAAATDWGADARIHVTGQLTVVAGAVLTIGAGTIVRVAPDLEIAVNGRLVVNGTLDRPVVFVPEASDRPWGGFLFRASTSQAEVTGAIFTGSGADPDWFDNNAGSGSSHKDEQCLFYLQNGARATLTDSFAIRNRGQFGHGEGSFLTMTRCLVQKHITAGQYNGGSVTLNDCALIEFPDAHGTFADNDNDGLYLTGGAHFITDTLIGWAFDDGVDSGSGSGGPVTVRGSWFESCYHEGMAWSETRLPDVKDTVSTNNGQGIECGFGEPNVAADHILSTANLSGARFGDNYDWDYDGFLRVTNSLLLFNRRDIWGRAWDDWTEHLDQMDLHDNFLSAPDANHPDNAVWNPATDADLLVPFLPTPAGPVGIGIALREFELDLAELASGVPVRLSSFTTAPVSVRYAIDSEDGPLGGGTLEFVPGETVKRLDLEVPDLANRELIVVSLADPVGGELTGREAVTFFRSTPEVLIAAGSVWKYLDTGVDQGIAWRAPEFNDAAWRQGPAELGLGDDREETPVNIGPDENRFPTIYFRGRFNVADPSAYGNLRIRLQRDDGAVVYLNGTEVFRSNLREGTITFGTFAETSSTSETAFFEKTVSAAGLVAGENVIAVEVHQADADSSDLAFDLELIGNRIATLPGGFVRGDAAADGELNISDGIKILLVLFTGTPTDCPDALDADDDGTTVITDAVYVLDYLFRGGRPIPPPFPGRGSDPTPDGLGCDRS